MAVSRRSRTINAPVKDVWAVIADPEHMPRWWPGVDRMEDVEEDRFTQVFKTKRGRPVRLDFRVIQSQAPYNRSWEQEVAGTPFERVLNESIIVVELSLVAGGTKIKLEQHQKLRGYSRTGGFLLRRATAKKLDEALDGLARILG
jgi:uncharacterized protein YndB with AHSA1/START domain